MQNLTILGGGFAGVWAAMSAAAERHNQSGESIQITLISKDANLTIRPKLYQAPTDDMQTPLAPLMNEIGVELKILKVQNVDLENRSVQLENGPEHQFDRLILATGSKLKKPQFAGVASAFSVDTYAEATQLQNHLQSLEPSQISSQYAVVIGGSMTGIEAVTELRERLGQEARLLLLEQNEKPGQELGDNFQTPITDALEVSSVESRMGVQIDSLSADELTLVGGETFPVHTAILATGLNASDLTKNLGVQTFADGRLPVDSDLKVSGLGGLVFAAGDTAHAIADKDHATLMSCQHAMPTGQVAGFNAVRDLIGLDTADYSQPFYATCVDLGQAGAVFSTGWDRQIMKTGTEGKATKNEINDIWISPPSPDLGRDAIFEKMQLQSQEAAE